MLCGLEMSNDWLHHDPGSSLKSHLRLVTEGARPTRYRGPRAAILFRTLGARSAELDMAGLTIVTTCNRAVPTSSCPTLCLIDTNTPVVHRHSTHTGRVRLFRLSSSMSGFRTCMYLLRAFHR
jgi:hypothetical protein